MQLGRDWPRCRERPSYIEVPTLEEVLQPAFLQKERELKQVGSVAADIVLRARGDGKLVVERRVEVRGKFQGLKIIIRRVHRIFQEFWAEIFRLGVPCERCIQYENAGPFLSGILIGNPCFIRVSQPQGGAGAAVFDVASAASNCTNPEGIA